MEGDGSQYQITTSLLFTTIPGLSAQTYYGCHIVAVDDNGIETLKTEIPYPIYTFGFGYSLDTELLINIANIGNGNFSFIPDSSFVGTIFIHALAHINTLIANNVYIDLTSSASIEDPFIIFKDAACLLCLNIETSFIAIDFFL